jgi:16S rRNA G527 N7-methylase RsmG
MNDDIEFFFKKNSMFHVKTIEKLNIYNDFLLENNKLLNLIGKNNRKTCFFKAF